MHIMQLHFPYILSKRRSELGKQIRRQYKNDIGVPYQACKQYTLNQNGACDTITTFTTDNNIIEMTDKQPDMEYHEHPTKEDLLEYFSQRLAVRKMTSKEAFRLMGVDDADIEKIQAYPFKTYAERKEAMATADKRELNRIKRASICKTAQYKCAGNSIVVNVLVNIFRTMFIPDQLENKQPPIRQSLFELY